MKRVILALGLFSLLILGSAPKTSVKAQSGLPACANDGDADGDGVLDANEPSFLAARDHCGDWVDAYPNGDGTWNCGTGHGLGDWVPDCQ